MKRYFAARGATEENLRRHDSERATEAFDLPHGLREDEEQLIREFFPPPPARIADLGCGNGRTTLPLSCMGYTVVGIEYSARLARVAKRHCPDLPVWVADARSLPFGDAVFDAAFFSWNGIDYMHPLSERIRVLDEVRRVLKAGAIFLFSSHNALGCVGRLLRPPLLARRAVRFWLDQSLHRRPLGGWYFFWRDDALGMPLFYSAPPPAQARLLRAQGWEIAAVRSAARPARRPWSLIDVHVHYVCRKPG